MSRPVLTALIVVALLLTGATGFAGASGDHTITVQNGETDIPKRTVTVAGQDFTVTSVAPIEPGKKLDVSVMTETDGLYDIFLYNSDQQIENRQIGASGDTTTNFTTESLSPGTYSLAVRTDQVETIQPVVITAYDTTLSAPDEVTKGENFSVNIETTEHDSVNAPSIEKVEAVIVDGSTTHRIEADQTDAGEYVTNATAEYDLGEYRLYAVVYDDEKVENGELNVIGMSDEQGLSVAEQNNNTEGSSDNQKSTDGSDGAGGSSSGDNNAGTPSNETNTSENDTADSGTVDTNVTNTNETSENNSTHDSGRNAGENTSDTNNTDTSSDGGSTSDSASGTGDDSTNNGGVLEPNTSDDDEPPNEEVVETVPISGIQFIALSFLIVAIGIRIRKNTM